MDNLTAGNPKAHRIRVYYSGSSDIAEGMPVCYSFDSTANWWGGSVANTGEITESTTVTEGELNPIRYIQVEDPDADNVHAFAGVVARGGWCGKTDPCMMDIYVPNGAVVPVLADQACVMGRTILCVATAELYLTAPHGTAGRPVAIAWETNADLSGDAGLILAKLDENLFIHQQGDADSLLVDDLDTAWQRVNTIQIETAGSQWLEVMNVGLEQLAACTGTGLAFKGQITADKVTSGGYCTALEGAVEIGTGFGGTATAAGGYRAISAKLNVATGADLSDQRVACLYLEHYIHAGATCPLYDSMIQLNCTGGTNKPDVFIYAQNPESLAYQQSAADAGSKVGAIKLLIAGATTSTVWIRTYDSAV